MNTEYNGWANFATWNVATWLMDYEGYYNLVRSTEGSYKDLSSILSDEFNLKVTPDGESFLGRDLDREALNNLLEELRKD